MSVVVLFYDEYSRPEVRVAVVKANPERFLIEWSIILSMLAVIYMNPDLQLQNEEEAIFFEAVKCIIISLAKTARWIASINA